MRIRTAERKDKEILLDLIKKLAAHERKKSDQIKMDIEKIEKHGFDNNYFQTLIAEYNDVPVAYAIYYFTYSGSLGAPVLYLEDLFVEENYRRKGIGKALLATLAELATKNECCRMDWRAYSWNEGAVQFYKSLGAELKSDLLLFRLANDGLVKLAQDKT